MTDELGLLRRTMGDLAEHGGDNDMYERSVARSRRMRRNNAVITSAVVALAVVGIGVGVVAINGPRPKGLPIGDSSTSVSTPPSPSSTPSAPPSTPAAPPRTTKTTPPPTSPSSKAAADDGCPVRASTLQQVAQLPDGYRIDADSVECWRGWASAGIIQPPGQHGDGITLFRYDPDRGWRRHSEGSGYHCEDLGIKKTSGEPPPFCTFGSVR